MKLRRRLGDKNQEFCTVYNMMRLASFLFRQTKDPAFLQYMEYNLYNGVLAQSYYESVQTESHEKKEGLLTYFLPMKAGSRKNWAGRMNAFFCCHGTMVQANARLNEGIFYQDGSDIYVAQYLDSTLKWHNGDKEVCLVLHQDLLNGLSQTSSVNDGSQTVNGTASAFENKPDFRRYVLTIHLPENLRENSDEVSFNLHVRIPEWIIGPAKIYRNGSLLIQTMDSDHFVTLNGLFHEGDEVVVDLPIGVVFIALPDDKDMGAFRYGAEALAAPSEQERILKLPKGKNNPALELTMDNERQWGTWNTCFQTENQDPGLSFVPVWQIGYEPYQMYFKIKHFDD